MKITIHSGIGTLVASQKLPISIEAAWDFLSDPSNLKRITPSEMNFEITSGEPAKMYEGQIISYKVSPVSFYRTNWVTEITNVTKPNYFIDEQRFGPYKMWHHEHRLEEIDNGVLMTDKISFKLPGGLIGLQLGKGIVKSQLHKIFNHRKNVLEEFFGKYK